MGNSFMVNNSKIETLVLGQATIGETEDWADSDQFSITLEAGRSYQFELKPLNAGEEISHFLYLYTDDEEFIDFESTIALSTYMVGYYSPVENGIYHLSVEGLQPMSYQIKAKEVSDDFSATTETRGWLSIGETAKGEIENIFDEDYFRIELVAGQAYEFNIKGIGNDPLLDPYSQLLNTQGEYMGEVEILGNESKITFTPERSGTYFLSVMSGSSESTGNYILSASASDSHSEDFYTATPFNLGEALTGRIESRDDKDSFVITLEEGGIYEFSLKSTGNDYLFAPSLGLYAYYDSTSPVVTSAFSNTTPMIYQASYSGDYHLTVQSSTRGTGDYFLQVRTIVDDYPSHTMTPSIIEIGSPTVGRFDYMWDEDEFHVTLEAGQVYEFNLTSENQDNSDPYIYISEGNRISIFDSSTTDEYAYNFRSPIVYTASQSGTATLLVGTHIHQSTPANYTLSVDLLDKNISLFATTTSDLYRLVGGSFLAVDESRSVLVNDYSINGQQLSATLVQTTPHGELTFNADGTFSYMPYAGFAGIDHFIYEASDGVNLSEPTTVTIKVSPEGAPDGVEISDFGSNRIEIDEGTAFSRLIRFTDDFDENQDGWTSIVSFPDYSQWFSSIDSTSNEFFISHYFTDNDNIYGGPITSNLVTLSVIDSTGDKDIKQFEVVVKDVAPTIELSGFSTGEQTGEYILDLGQVIDPGNDTISQYTIHWGDGNWDNVFSPHDVTHIYNKNGEYLIQVDLLDEDGKHLNAGNLQVAINDAEVYENVQIGYAPDRITRSEPNLWLNAWTNEILETRHKGVYEDLSEVWTNVNYSSLNSSALSGGDVFGGDLGVSGQSKVTSNITQEIDGTEALRFDLAVAASSIVVDLSRLEAGIDKRFYDAGRLQLLNGEGEIVDEMWFSAIDTSDASDDLQIVLTPSENFTSAIFTAGVYDDNGQFIYGGLADLYGNYANNAIKLSDGLGHGSNYMISGIEFGF